MYDACVVFLPDPFTGTNFKSLGIDSVATRAEYAEFEKSSYREAELIAKYNYENKTGFFSILTILYSFERRISVLDNVSQLFSFPLFAMRHSS